MGYKDPTKQRAFQRTWLASKIATRRAAKLCATCPNVWLGRSQRCPACRLKHNRQNQAWRARRTPVVP